MPFELPCNCELRLNFPFTHPHLPTYLNIFTLTLLVKICSVLYITHKLKGKYYDRVTFKTFPPNDLYLQRMRLCSKTFIYNHPKVPSHPITLSQLAIIISTKMKHKMHGAI